MNSHPQQILSITADNASSNDTMITELADMVGHFGGKTAQTCCFLHVVNLVAKSLLKQFDVPKKQADEYLGSSETELRAIAEEIEVEDEATIAENGDGDPNADDIDDLDGWTDEVGNMTEEEQEELEENIRPIRFVLVKVSSSTKEHLPRNSQIQPAMKTRIQNCPFINLSPA